MSLGKIAPLLVLLLSLPAVLPFFHPGFFPIHDDTQVARVYEMGKSLHDGMFPVRWVGDLGYGYGYPIFNFYSPFPYYVGGILTLFGVTALDATKITFIIGILFAACAMYFFAKSFLGEAAAVVAGVTYLYFPYHAVNTYVRGDLDELAAYAFLPLVFLGLYKLFYYSNTHKTFERGVPWILLSGVSIALVALSHNLSLFMLLLLSVFLFIISFILSRDKRTLTLFYGASFALGFLLSSWYALPAVFEIQYTNVKSIVGGGSRYVDHFVCLPQLWDSPWGFGGSAPGCLDGISFRLGKQNIAFVALSFVLFILSFTKEKKKWFLYATSFLLFIFSIFMMLDYSSFLWSDIPFMSFLQFPWRFLDFTGLFLSLLIAFLVHIAIQRNMLIGLLAAIFIIGITILFNAKLFEPQLYNGRNSEFYTNDRYIQWDTSKISDEYMPSAFQKPHNPNEIPHSPFEITKGSGDIQVVQNKVQYKSAQVLARSDIDLKANIAYFPTWRIYVDTHEVSYAIGKNGFFITIPSGQHMVEAKFVETPIERWSNFLTVFGIFAFFFGIIKHSSFGKQMGTPKLRS